MKQITIILSLIIGLFAFTNVNAQKNKNMDQFEVQVDGLGCPFCAYGLEKKFKEFKGIKNVAIDIETGDFSFSYPAEKELSLEAVLKQVEKAGYTPNEAKITRANGAIVTTKKVEKTETIDLASNKIYVNGKCGMCKARIEKAASDVYGVATASWNVETNMLLVTYDDKQTSISSIEKAAAAAGHDTKTVKSDDATYDALPACCHYKRNK